MLEALDREIFDKITPTASSRRPFDHHTTTLAMHWDGTYRDRVIYTKDDPTYWDDEDEAAGISPGPAELLAKHLTFSDTALWNRFTDPAY